MTKVRTLLEDGWQDKAQRDHRLKRGRICQSSSRRVTSFCRSGRFAGLGTASLSVFRVHATRAPDARSDIRADADHEHITVRLVLRGVPRVSAQMNPEERKRPDHRACELSPKVELVTGKDGGPVSVTGSRAGDT